MKKNNTTAPEHKETCKNCGEKYTVKERNRVYGVNPLMGGYCSAGCYTEGVLMKPKQDAGYTPGKLEVDIEDKHTPTNQEFLEISDGHKIIARVLNEKAEVGTTKKEAASNAARIVKTWNEYDGLKAENERLHEALEESCTMLKHLSKHLTATGIERLKYFYSLL